MTESVARAGPHQRRLIRAAMVADACDVLAAPGAILVQGATIVAAGSPESIGPVADARPVDQTRALVIPALVNAHAHLDLSHLGPLPWSGDFTSWVEHVRHHRASEPRQIRAAVRRGVELSRAGGTALIGDISGIGSTTPSEVLREAGLAGVSFVEVFGIGAGRRRALETLRRIDGLDPDFSGGVRLGVQPHAPYSCSLEVYEAAARLGRPLATHLAETLEELRFLETGDGPLAEMLRRFGAWEPPANLGPGGHPVEHLADVLRRWPFLAAHLNYVQPEHIERLAQWPVTVAYCPRASASFGHPQHGHESHPYRQMLHASVPVALGTDSLLCLDTPDRISVLDEMRFLFARDGVEPVALLRLATTAGASALGFDPQLVTLAPGPTAGLLAIEIDPGIRTDPFRQALRSRTAPRWILGPVPGGDLIS